MRGSRVIPGMLHNTFANFKRQVQAVEPDITMLEVFHDAKRVKVVIEPAAVGAHQFVEFPFSRMAEWRMADIMHQCQRLNQFRVDAQSSCNGTGDLGDFQRVGQPVAKMIGETSAENLGFCFQPAECSGMDDTVAVPRVLTAIGVNRFS